VSKKLSVQGVATAITLAPLQFRWVSRSFR
jgi:hypothetical protein